VKKKVIVIHGTPGTGKTTISRYLCKRIGAIHINISKIVRDERLYVGVDERRYCTLIADIEKLTKRLVDLIKSDDDKYFVIEGHFADIVPREYVKKVIVLRLDPRELEKRLIKRGWPEKKIAENVLAEILDECLIEAVNAYGEEVVREIDVTGKQIDEIVAEIVKAVEDGDEYKPGKVNWLKKLEHEGVMDEYLSWLSSKA